MILLVLSGNEKKAPYVSLYKQNFNCKVVEWNRIQEVNSNCEYSFYCKESEGNGKILSGIFNYCRYSLFLRKIIKKNKFETIVVFNVFNFLIHALFNFWIFRKKKIIVDFRDLPRFFNLYKSILNLLIRILAKTVVLSSYGFFKYFKHHKILMIHNLQNFNSTNKKYKPLKEILTIGSIRDFNSNIKVITKCSSLGIKSKISGDGPALDDIKKTVKTKNLKNIDFTGRFLEKDKIQLASSCQIINNFNESDSIGKNLISNRFYLALQLGLPQLVNTKTFQGSLAIKNGFGIKLSQLDFIKKKWNKEIFLKYQNSCTKYLNKIIEEQNQNLKSLKDDINKS